MRAVLVVVANILREQAFQVAFVNCDDVIQEITAATPYPTLCDSILPRTFERGADRTHAQGSNRCGHFQSILPDLFAFHATFALRKLESSMPAAQRS